MALALDVLSWLCLGGGAIFMVITGIGLVRLPDVFCRMHAAGIGDTLGMILILLGLALQTDWGLNLFKLLLIFVFIVFTSPTSTNALAKAALLGGVKPIERTEGEDAPS